MKTKSNKSNKHHLKGGKKTLGISLIAIAGILFIFHYLFPDQQLWPVAALCAIVLTMVVSHIKKTKINKVNEKNY